MRELSSFRGKKVTYLIKARYVLWMLTQILLSSRFVSNGFRVLVLRSAGAQIGQGVVIKTRLRVHFPWNLEIGDDCWIGEEVWFINHEKVKIGSNVCISQRSIICSGGHDYRSASLEYAHKPIEIKDGAWVCLDAKVLPGVTIGECSVVSAGEIVRRSIPDYSMLIAGEIRPIDPPK